MDKETKKIQFDPGYAPLVISSLGQAGYTYYTFSAIPDLKLKRLNFPHTLRKLEGFLKTNIAFYMGCLLWACYIAQFDCEIEGNKLLGEKAEEKEYTDEINFLIDLLKNQLMRDCKYFQNKTYEPDARYIPILETYKDFLILNKGFVNCSKTSQIIIPKNLKKLDSKALDEINNKIQNALEEKNIDKLLNYYELIF